MDFTCVEIKNVKYIKLISLDRKSERELDLTTIHTDQELAYLNIFHVDKNKKKTLLKCIEIKNIRPGLRGIPELHLSVSYDGTQYYKIRLKLNGYIYHNSVVDIRQIGKSPRKINNKALLALALLVLLFLGFFTLRAVTGKGNDLIRYQSSMKTAQKSATESDTAESDTAESDTAELDTAESDTAESDTIETDPIETDTIETDTIETDTIETDTIETNAIDSKYIETQTIETSELVNNRAVVYFYPNSSVLTRDAKSILIQILNILNNNTNLDVEILGHCAFFGTEKGRQEISNERAENVYSFFISNGWTPDSQPLLAGLGHQKIVTKDPDKQNLNRRVEINIESTKEN